MKGKGFHMRGFVSLLTFGSFIVMTVNGIVLYFAPQGRIAYWINWKFLGLTKENWGNMHIISSLLFVAVGIIHLVYNWTPILNYLSKKVSRGVRWRKELVLAVAISVFMVLGPVYKVFPLNYVIDLSNYLSAQWISTKEHEPPFGHAEQASLKTFTKRVNMDLNEAMAELKAQGINIQTGEESLDKIAKTNKTSPMKIYALIKKLEKAPPVEKKSADTPEKVEEQFAGTGVGRKTLAEICKEIGVDLSLAKERLRNSGVEMKDDEVMKEAATKRKVNSIDLLKVILVENYKLP